MKNSITVMVLAAVSMLLAWGCSTSEDGRRPSDVGTPSESTFVSPEAGADVEVPRGLLSYCPTNECPPGWTTCPGSRFPCDVNLRADVNNCGACGLACPTDTGAEVFACVNGACALSCRANSGLLDCDGLVDNGCEALALHDSHCGSCGKKCTDPKKRCVDQSGRAHAGIYGCGCPSNNIYCDGGCWDPKFDDDYCGNCSTRCDPENGGAPKLPNAYYGCVNAECGRMKCNPRYADCDQKTANGCETFLVDDANCGACGNACPSGQSCRLDLHGVPQCMCPPDKTYCHLGCFDGVCSGQCVDLTSDQYNCGACGNDCYIPARNATGSCHYGTCVMDCNDGRADCNNSQSDGCEVNIYSDPRNCGACGNVCDEVAGQACVAGKCVVKPCDQDAGVEVPR